MSQPLPRKRSAIYVLTESHMGKLDELITEIQAVYCDILSNRQFLVTSGPAATPASGLTNAVIENHCCLEQVISD